MPEHKPPRTIQTRLTFLQDACRRNRIQSLLPDDVTVELEACLHLFDPLVFCEVDGEAERLRLSQARKQAFARLNMLIRHYWQAMRSMMRLGMLSPAAWLDVGLNKAGRNLRLVRMSEKLNAARLLVSGAAVMQARGWQVPSQPEAAEVAAAAEQARTLIRAYDNHTLQRMEQQQTLKTVMARIDRVYHQVFHYLKIELRHTGAAATRRIMRQYGIVFRYRPDRDRVPEKAHEGLLFPVFPNEPAPEPAATTSLEEPPEATGSLHSTASTHVERKELRHRERLAERRFHRKCYRHRKRRRQRTRARPVPVSTVCHHQDPTGAIRAAHAI